MESDKNKKLNTVSINTKKFGKIHLQIRLIQVDLGRFNIKELFFRNLVFGKYLLY